VGAGVSLGRWVAVGLTGGGVKVAVGLGGAMGVALGCASTTCGAASVGVARGLSQALAATHSSKAAVRRSAVATAEIRRRGLFTRA
jgi:hypothetical protein